MRHSTGAEPGNGRNDVAIWLRSVMAFRFSRNARRLPKPPCAFGVECICPSYGGIWLKRPVASTFRPSRPLCQFAAIIARRALVSPETICYTPRAGSFRLLPRAVVAELVDAQR